ncbi:MAG TPA: phosphate ABC transporter substrate-binding protein PstS [Mycobacteriales bacterium]|nr:phosphate ABC transporter substrate-binding protein PstS [Mycobacteriales bacterium]
MKVSLVTRTAGLAAVAAIGLAACGSSSSGAGDTGNTSGGSTALTPQGSTFQQTLEQQWASKYHQAHSGAQITYSGTGSSAGIEQFTAGKVAFAGSDVTMAADEQSAANTACGSTALTLPITSGGVAIIYNVKGVSNLNLSAATLAGIFMGKITKWNDPAIAGENPSAKLPDTSIATFHRSDGSGTTNVLSGFLDATAKDVWTLGVNKEFTWPSGQGAVGSSGVVQGVKNTDGGITYAEITYAKQAQLPTAAIEGAKKGYVSISSASVAKSINSGFSVTGTAPDLAGALDFTKMTGYPISTVSYVLVCSKYKDSAEGALVRDYLTYAAGDGQAEADALGFAPLPSKLDQQVLTSVATIS